MREGTHCKRDRFFGARLEAEDTEMAVTAGKIRFGDLAQWSCRGQISIIIDGE